jgi:beta-glucosidase
MQPQNSVEELAEMDYVDDILRRLTLKEKVELLAAKDWWRTAVIDRDDIFVPHVKVSLPLLPIK